MSKYRIAKYNRRPNNFQGNRLREHAHIIEDTGYSIEFACRGGLRFFDQYFWLKNNLQRKVNIHHHVCLYIWLGSCDLTSKKNIVYFDSQNRRRRSFIELRHNSDTAAVTYIQNQIKKYLSFVSQFPTVKIVFLKVSYYSIQKYNKYLGNENCEDHREQDFMLMERIDLINNHIQEVNTFWGVTSINFKKDLSQFRKASGAYASRSSLDFSSYSDGLHPDRELAYCWLKKIVTQIFIDCKKL